MIRVTNIRNKDTEIYDEVGAIVRSLKSRSAGIWQVTDLAPSSDLFREYQKLAREGNWNADTFSRIYVPRFLQELRQSQGAYKKFQYLCEQDWKGKHIKLVCFCADETLCHRSIIAGMLQGAGCNVVTDTGKDYTRYYNQFYKIRR